MDINEAQIKAATLKIKNLADTQKITLDHVDSILMKLALGPKISSSQFNILSSSENPEIKKAANEAMRAVAQYEAAVLEEAFQNITTNSESEKRKYTLFELKGHLFDEALLNRVFDIAVESKCDYTVMDLNVAEVNEKHTTTILKLTADNQTEITKTLQIIEDLIKSNPAAEATLKILLDK